MTAITVRRLLAVIGFIAKKSIEMLSVLKGIDMIRMVVEITKAPIATGAALKNRLRSRR